MEIILIASQKYTKLLLKKKMPKFSTFKLKDLKKKHQIVIYWERKDVHSLN